MQPDHHNQAPLLLIFSALKGWIKLLLLLAGFLCFLAGGWWLYCLSENERGRQEWGRVKAELEAKGESLDWAVLLPVTIPDEENFAEAPIIEKIIYRDGPASAEARRIKSVDASPLASYLPDIEKQRPVDLKRMARDIGVWTKNDGLPLAETNDAARVVGWFDLLKPDLEQIQEACHHPKTQFAIDLSSGFLLPTVDCGVVRVLAQQMAVLASAYLENDESNEALNCLRVNLAMARGLTEGPTLLGVMIGVAVENLTMSVVWQGMVDGGWNDEQLAELNRLLQARNWLASLQQGMRCERAMFSSQLKDRDSIWDMYDSVVVINGPKPRWKSVARKLVPFGWSQQSLAVYCTAIQDFSVAFYDPLNRRARPEVLEGWLARMDSISSSRHPRDRFVGMMVPNFVRAHDIVAKLQVHIDQARIAMAISQFTNRNGHLPDSLGDLVGPNEESRPDDLFGGAPYQYRRLTDEHYLIWSVGWNELDEGGQIAPGRTDGDWVWFSFPKDQEETP